MNDTNIGPIDRRSFDAAVIALANPPVFKHAHKQAVHRLAAAASAVGTIGYSRWPERPLPERVPDHRTAISAVPEVFTYDAGEAGVWHLNFADPRLFFAYGSALLAQDELQVLEHPALASVREALVAEGLRAVTTEDGHATPVLVTGAPRRCELDTSADVARPRGLYGNHFARAPLDVVLSALRVLEPPTRTNVIAMAAPSASGPYDREDLTGILATAWTAFSAAVEESLALWPAASVEIHTGFWGCGAFGGNRTVMVALQAVAAHLAGVDRVVFHTVDQGGLADYEEGAALTRALMVERSAAALLDAVLARGYLWGQSNGT